MKLKIKKRKKKKEFKNSIVVKSSLEGVRQFDNALKKEYKSLK